MSGRIYAIAALQRRYQVEPHTKPGRYRIRNRDAGDCLPAEYDTQALAESGARLQAACDIDALYDAREGR